MIHIKTFLLSMMLTAASTLMAQHTTVKGVIVSETTQEGEPFVTVKIFHKGDTTKAVAMFLSDEQGHFSSDVEGKGMMEAYFSSIGKKDLVKEFEIGNEPEVDLGTLIIKDDAKMLNAVEVTAMKPLVKMEVDKMSYNVADDRDSKSSTVLDMLRKVPMVTVDGQDNITVNGNSSFKVYVDGKPNVMFSSNPSMVFKSMPATAVKSIEVMTNPGAKYDAEGAGGVLNIVMNRQDPMAMESLNGYNGSVRVAAGNTGIGGGVFLNGQQGKVSYNVNVMENYVKPGTSKIETEQQNGDGIIKTLSETDTKLPFTMGSFSLGYELDPMSSVSATASITDMNMKNYGYSLSEMGGGNYGTGYSYRTDTDMRNERTSFSGNVDYQRFFNKARTSSITLTYQLNYSPAETKMRNSFDNGSTSFIDLTDRYSLNKEKTTDHTFQVDFTTPVATGQSLSLGSKLMTRRATSDAKYYLHDLYDQSSSMDYLYKNTIMAGYAEYSANWGKIGAKGGLRYEHIWQNVEYKLGNGTDFETNYGSLVPTANLSYNISMTSNIGLTYNMRISRPGITYLNPYINQSDPTSLSYGNTDLDVEKAHNIALVYNLFSPKLMMNVNVHHNFVDNGIEQYSFYDGNLLNTTYGNIVKRSTTGVSVYANVLAAKDTRLFVNGAVNYVDMSSKTLGLSNNGWQANAMAGVQQTLPWDLKLSVYAITSTKTYTMQGWSSGFNMLTGNISKSFFNDKLTLSVNGLIGLTENGNLKMESYSKGNNFSTYSNISVPISGVTFNVTYTFGKGKRQMKQHVSRVTNDYIEQQSQGEMLNSVGTMPQQGSQTQQRMPMQ